MISLSFCSHVSLQCKIEVAALTEYGWDREALKRDDVFIQANNHGDFSSVSRSKSYPENKTLRPILTHFANSQVSYFRFKLRKNPPK